MHRGMSIFKCPPLHLSFMQYSIKRPKIHEFQHLYKNIKKISYIHNYQIAKMK